MLVQYGLLLFVLGSYSILRKNFTILLSKALATPSSYGYVRGYVTCASRRTVKLLCCLLLIASQRASLRVHFSLFMLVLRCGGRVPTLSRRLRPSPRPGELQDLTGMRGPTWPRLLKHAASVKSKVSLTTAVQHGTDNPAIIFCDPLVEVVAASISRDQECGP